MPLLVMRQQQTIPCSSSSSSSLSVNSTTVPVMVATPSRRSRGNSNTKRMKTTVMDYLQDFEWRHDGDGIGIEKNAASRYWWDDLFARMTQANLLEPHTAINDSCTAPDLSMSTTKCRRDTVFAGSLQEKKVGHAIILGFDVDVLEIHLNEVYDVVDKFFIVEWDQMHNGARLKALTWDSIKQQPRFRKFEDKVVHFILDDVDTLEVIHATDEDKMWARESYQEAQRWDKIKRWNAKTNFFGPNDLIGFGDADEVPSRENLYRLKHCALNPGIRSVDIGIWFPYGLFSQAFRTDFPVSRQHPYTLGDPTFWTFRAAMESNSVPSRRRGMSGTYLLGGVHLSHNGYLPFQILKKMTCTECDPHTAPSSWWALELQRAFQNGTWRELESKLAQTLPGHMKNVVPVNQTNVIAYRPWFYTCNPERYPSWEGKPDSRIGA